MKRIVLSALVAAAALAAGGVGYVRVFSEDAAPPEWILSTYSGEVTVSLGGAAWRPADIKMRLTHRDRVRTAGDGEATLVHEASHVTVRPRSELQVADLTLETSRFALTSGTVFVEARGDRVQLRSFSGAQADTNDAGMGMTVKPDGYTLVQVKRGAVDFTAMGRTERVGEGQQADARAGRPPSHPVSIPEAILLNVRFPDAETFNTRLARISGKTDPGTALTVGGRDVPTAEDGSFEVEVIMNEGLNEIEVEATDPLGRTRVERSAPIDVDVTAPGLIGATLGARPVGVAVAGATRP